MQLLNSFGFVQSQFNSKFKMQEELPNNWATYPAPVELAEIGNDWVQKQDTVAICVPSSITPNGEGRNYILNPAHPDFARVRIIKIEILLNEPAKSLPSCATW
ncbi:MAG: RES family NAD+ phosphorylase [Xenococcus sp. MO_188.B8]|nr:RES family NAD+ phosphorylase [Xenococcus sp. MO_188.B8]